MRADILSAITRVCDSQQFIMGPEVEQLESEVASAIGIPYAVAVSSGTDALLVALMPKRFPLVVDTRNALKNLEAKNVFRL